jgi:hypothetical protein
VTVGLKIGLANDRAMKNLAGIFSEDLVS